MILIIFISLHFNFHDINKAQFHLLFPLRYVQGFKTLATKLILSWGEGKKT